MAGVLRSEMQSGLSRQVVEFPTIQRTFTVKWGLTGAEFDTFQTWFADTLDSGTLYWSLPAPFGATVPADPNAGIPVRFVGAKFTANYINHDAWDVSATVEREIDQTASDPMPNPVPNWWRSELTVVGDDELDSTNDDAEIHAAPDSGEYYTLTIPDSGDFTFGINLTGLGGVLLVKESGDAGIGAPPPAPVSIFTTLTADLVAQSCGAIVVPGDWSNCKANQAGSTAWLPGMLLKRINNPGTAGGNLQWADATLGNASLIHTGISLANETSSITARASSMTAGLSGNVSRLYGIIFARSTLSTTINPTGLFNHGGTFSVADRYCCMDLTDTANGANALEGTLRFGSASTAGKFASFTGNILNNGWHYATGQFNHTTGIFKIRVDGVAGTDSSTAVTLHASNTTDTLDVMPNQVVGNSSGASTGQVAAVFVNSDLSKLAALEAILAQMVTDMNAGTFWT